MKYNVKYTAEEMARIIHRQAMKAMWRKGYCDEMASYYSHLPNSYCRENWENVDKYNQEADEYEKLYCILEGLAFEAGTPMTFREENLAHLMGSIAAKKEQEA